MSTPRPSTPRLSGKRDRRLFELHNAEASLAIEGMQISAEARPLFDQYVSGQLTADELQAAVLKLYGAKGK